MLETKHILSKYHSRLYERFGYMYRYSQHKLLGKERKEMSTEAYAISDMTLTYMHTNKLNRTNIVFNQAPPPVHKSFNLLLTSIGRTLIRT